MTTMMMLLLLLIIISVVVTVVLCDVDDVLNDVYANCVLKALT